MRVAKPVSVRLSFTNICTINVVVTTTHIPIPFPPQFLFLLAFWWLTSLPKSRSVALLFQVIMLCSRYRHTFCPFPACYCYRVNSRRVNKLFMRLAAPPLGCVARLSLLDVVFPFPFSCFYESPNPTGVIFGSNVGAMPSCEASS